MPASVARSWTELDILRDPNHPTRADEQLSKRLEELLGSSYATCVATLNLINDDLNEVTKETRGFGDLIENKVSRVILPPRLVPSYDSKDLVN